MLRIGKGLVGKVGGCWGVRYSSLMHNSKLDVEERCSQDRKTKIICTAGPACWDRKTLCDLLLNGMNTMRLNFSHGSYEDKIRAIQTVRELTDSFRFTEIDFSDGSCEDVCAIAADTKGPEIRTGVFQNGINSVPIERGQEVIVTTNKKNFEGTNRLVYMDYPDLAHELGIGQTIWVDDGHLQLEVISRQPEEGTLTCVSHTAGQLGTQKGVNIPYPFVSNLPSVTDKDKKDLKFAVEHGTNFVFASFIREAKNIRAIREVLGKGGSSIKIIAKIENEQGVENFDEILEEADGVMVARGDLGIEIPPQKVNVAQKMMIAKCNLAGKPVICATQMLESMISAPRATRAECSDVINAVLDGADAVMLSGETAKGQYPIETLQLMSSLCLEAEVAINYESLFQEIIVGKQEREREGGEGGLGGKRGGGRKGSPFSQKVEAVAASAVTAAFSLQASAIIVVAEDEIAAAIAKFRPSCPILYVTHRELKANGLMLTRGIVPIVIPQDPTKEVEKTIYITTKKAKSMNIVKQGSPVLVVEVKNNKPHLIFVSTTNDNQQHDQTKQQGQQ